MQPDVLARFEPTPEIVALGRPERVFHQAPGLVRLAHVVALVLGFLMVALGGGALTLYLATAPPQAKTQGTMIAASVVPGFFLIFGAVLLMFGTRPSSSSPVYAIYPGAMAFRHDEVWSIVRWDEVDVFCSPGLKSIYGRLRLHDGREVVLRNEFFQPALFYNEVEWYVAGKRPSFVAATGAIRTTAEAVSQATAALGAASGPMGRMAVAGPRPPTFEELRRRVRHKAIGQLVIGAIGMVLPLGYLGLNWGWIPSALEGPVPITLAELRSLSDPSALPNPWVKVKIGRTVETGVDLIQTRGTTGRVKSRYILVGVLNRWMIAELPPGSPARGELVGYLGAWRSPLPKQVVEDIEKKFPASSSPMLPFQLDCEYQYQGQCLAMVLIAIVIPGTSLKLVGQGCKLLKLANEAEVGGNVA